MKCPFNEETDFDCPYVDIPDRYKEWDCDKCIYNLDYADRLDPKKEEE